MKIIECRVLRGPNLHARKPCLEAVLDLEELDEVDSNTLPGFVERLVDWLPGLHQHHCSPGHAGGFIERLHEGTWLGHVTEHVQLELQSMVGPEVRFGRTRMIPGRPRCYRVVCAYKIEAVAVRALHHAVALVQAAVDGRAFDLEAAQSELRRLASRHGPGPSTSAVIEAAAGRGIPVLPLSDDGALYQLGWGALQRRIDATLTSETRQVSVDIACDKEQTKQLLAIAGIPVPRGRTVDTLEAALEAAREIGGTVTLKPLGGNQGKGVSTQVSTPEQVAVAFERAQHYDGDVIVEQTVSGYDHRVLVVGRRVVAVARRRPPTVVGDGRANIRELVDRLNADPRRGEGHDSALTLVPLDDSARDTLATQGLTLDSVPPAGTEVRLRGNANLSTGGVAEDVTDIVHPSTAALCVRAARRIGLDVAGIDVVCEDITRPLDEQGGALIEVNAAPGIRMHEWPYRGEPRAAGRAIVDSLFAPHEDGRIPLVAVTGTNGKTTTVLAIDHVLRATGRRTGCATTEGVFIDGQPIMAGDCSGYWSAQAVLTDPDVEAAVLETARGGILKRGLGFDRCDVAVVLNIAADHLGQDGIDTLEDLARVKSVVADAATGAVVLNADDPHCVAMTETVRPGAEILYFSMDPHNLVLARHLRGDGRAVVLRQGVIWLQGRGWGHPVIETAGLPFTFGGKAPHNVANALAAVAALVALRLHPDDIARALARFSCSAESNPLRMNVFEVRGVRVVVDYAHNPAAFEALLETVRLWRAPRVVGVVSAPGDRRDAELEEVGGICARHLDEMVVFELDEDRGRRRGETAEVILRGAEGAGADHQPREAVLPVREALARALQRCRPGDVLVYGCAVELDDLYAAAAGSQVEELPPTVFSEPAALLPPAVPRGQGAGAMAL
ncbi:cyanophycin synthetase [Caldimonas brevitalea]|uniref:Cyanophycin synthetase n=1 Tax=Caldimonas brevitalea TaxID=413882 RepID=A0A0G3BKG8_9BURK|nr:cyanophycin synthetase [Caldimonas brevitalea]AKJ27856.1 cyanophycin synthetase [Caldimonas brevitalea]